MMRKSPSASMQKTYDECYLICSTAIYFEGQNNEAEALRAWRNALDQIYYHNAYKLPASWVPRSETEKALHDSLRAMELQCKERVELLDALQKSREEADEAKYGNGDDASISTGSAGSLTSGQARPAAASTWFKQNTAPPASYPDLSRPVATPERRPVQSSKRPSFMRKASSEKSTPRAHTLNAAGSPTPQLTPPTEAANAAQGRTPSPEKKIGGMLRTLRSQPKDRSSAKMPSTLRSQPAAAKAATQVWNGHAAPPAQQNGGSTSAAAHPSAPVQPKWDPYTRSLVERPAPARDSVMQQQPAPRYGPQGSFIRPPSPSDYLQRHSVSAVDDWSQPRSPPIPRKGVSRADKIANILNSTAERQRLDNTNSALSSKLSYDPKTTGSNVLDSRAPAGNAVHRAKSVKDKIESRAVPAQAIPPPIAEVESGGGDNATAAPSAEPTVKSAWDARVQEIMKDLPSGVDENAAKQIFTEIVIQGDEVHWDDVAGLEAAKSALKETVVYPFLRPDLFMGLREPARGMLLFGPPGTGKTMLARAVATESRSTFFAISASSLTSKFLGDSEKLVRALFALAKRLAPTIIFVDEIDSLLSARGGSSEHEASRRIKTEFLIQWSDLQRAAAGRDVAGSGPDGGDATRVLVLAATNLPWAIDEAARRRFVRRQYIPLPEDHVREKQLRTLLAAQKHSLRDRDLKVLVGVTDGYSGSDITALAKDAAMGPLRSLGEQLLHMAPDDIRPIDMRDFEASLVNIRPSVSKQGLQAFEDWAREFGERGG
ncbi:AAA-domain-containing protein [Dissoconium aciculare CBS 342.82]|uniref:AAA-domain-containing protein n=1 Tax=Dissoconium aciculare CBS 342.82 TaxID=1314786 RepID=A0A6J3MDS7_9PEZI|nr:AAA-domain-containing protein [Dissoconium aciculare CBS 342.82]KAF1825002.1 AAA-domain-containing protein [Dissoconium aciculare CBS 342.82]